MSLNHPAKDQLIAFGQGKLAADESSSVESHLEVCRECCETLLDLKDDTFVGLVRVAKPNASEADRAARSEPQAKGVGSSTSHALSDGQGVPPTARTGKSAPATDAATVLVQSGQTFAADDLPRELAEHPRYRIVELIGRGGMGNVYRAEHRLMNRAVAIKLINSQLMQHPHAVERFRREVQAAAKLSHPNIVAAYDAEQAGNAHFLVMEFVEGTDLASVVKQRGPMSVTEACECIRQAAVGLQHAHERGMVHRDIKPHNLMLAAGGQVRILDFGLAGFAEAALGRDESFNRKPQACASSDTESSTTNARAYGVRLNETAAHLTTMGSVMGTPDYMAPEQAADAHSADIRADIYSLGCTLHFLLTGKPPFEADNVLAKLKAHAEQLPPVLTALRNDVPAELAIVVKYMMAKNPADRFQTPAEVAAALAPFVQQATAPPRRGLRTLMAAALLGAAALLAGVIYVETDKGQFVIETADDQVAVMIGEKGVKIRDATTDREYLLKPGPTRIRSGEYDIVVTELPAGLEFSPTKTFRLKRGGVERVTVRFKSKAETIAAAVSDEQRLQGKWIAVSGHARKKPLTGTELAQLSITFDGERVEFVQPSGPPTTLAANFTINSNRDPKQIDFVAPGKQEAMPGIYQFDGERLKLALIDQDYSRPTNFEPDHRPDHLTAEFERLSVAAALGQEEQKVLKAAETYLAVVDADKFDQLFDIGSNLAKKHATREQILQTYQTIRNTLGKLEKRTLKRVRLIDEFIGLPAGRYAAVQFVSDFETHKGLWETVILNVDDDGQWRANTYASTVQPLPLPEPKSKQRSAAEVKGPPTSPPGKFSAAPKQPQRRVGLLTNPPTLPPEGLPVGRNLIVDPSLESTPPGELPRRWFAWLDDGPNFKCEVVEGGVTGKHCLQISGTGTRGVVFATSIPLDRTKRFALKGRVKVEGEAGTWAVIKLNYFNNTGWLGVDDRIGVTTSDFDWKLLEKTDLAEKYPAATLLVPTCHIEGNGTAWFDDLEVIAYDLEKLPADFDATHGRNNRMK